MTDKIKQFNCQHCNQTLGYRQNNWFIVGDVRTFHKRSFVAVCGQCGKNTEFRVNRNSVKKLVVSSAII